MADDPEIRKLQRDLKAQNKQLEQIKYAESYFEKTGDIGFWLNFGRESGKAAGCCSTVQNGHSDSLICI